MVDIFKIPLYYISFKKDENLEQEYLKYGFKTVKWFPAIDGRKLNIDDLRKNNIISIRAYDDLKSGRHEHSGLTTMGAIGCTLSHFSLWNLCIKENLPFIIITEEDNEMDPILLEGEIKSIQDTLNKPNSIFVSAEISNEDHRKHFFGLHFYIVSQEACLKLVKECFPMDVQTDWYMAHLATRGDITLEGFPISEQKWHPSSIQSFSIKPMLPKGKTFYIFFILILFCSIGGFIYFKKRYKKCEETC
jgi:GR25 family glycosyltransferase involved in LPS biosynthesis